MTEDSDNDNEAQEAMRGAIRELKEATSRIALAHRVCPVCLTVFMSEVVEMALDRGLVFHLGDSNGEIAPEEAEVGERIQALLDGIFSETKH